MVQQKIRGRETPSYRTIHCTGCAAWDSCPGFVCSEEVAGNEVLSRFPRKEILELEFDDLVSWSDITSDLKWLRPVV
jgi:hypothetical protein